MGTRLQMLMKRATRLSMWRPAMFCVLTMLATAAAAQVFECVDARGAKQYAQFCPPGTVQQRQVVKEGAAGAASPAGAVAPKSIELQDAEFRQRQFERQEAETKAAQEKTQTEEAERNCLEARAQLKFVLEGQRMLRFDPVTGERIQVGDEERADEAERQRKAISVWCK